MKCTDMCNGHVMTLMMMWMMIVMTGMDRWRQVVTATSDLKASCTAPQWVQFSYV